MVVSLPLFPLPNSPLPGPSTHSRVSAGMCSLSLRDFMPRPGPRLSNQVPMPPSWPPNPDCGASRRTDRRGRQDRTPGRRGWRGEGAGPPRARGADSPRLEAGLGVPHLRASPARQERSGYPGRRSWVLTPPGEGRPVCRVSSPRAFREEGRSLPSMPALLLHRRAPPPPGLAGPPP